jgi:hypothetical protein
MSDKKFIGIVKVINTKFGELIKIGIPEKDFVQHIKNGWVNMVLKKSQKGGYYLEIDDFEPKEKQGTSHTVKNQQEQFHAGRDPVGDVDNSLPF